VRLVDLTLHRAQVPLVSPFTTSFGTETVRDVLILALRAEVDGTAVVGWSECVAGSEPLYSSEYVDGASDVIRRWLAPMLFAAGELSAQTVAGVFDPVKGHRMAKAALETAVLDAQLRAQGRSFAEHLGVTRTSVPSGVSVGIHDSVASTLDAVAGYLDQGYVRIKLKIRPGWDIQPVAAVRDRFGADIPLQVDANAAYTLADTAALRRLDAFGLLLVEQPLGEEDLRQHAELARRISTPVCLDESVVSAAAAADAIALGACSVINIKPGRVGGYLEAWRIHDLARAHGVAVWCGGMLETGIGRVANAALAGLPGFTLPGDISGSDRFYATDLTEPVCMRDGAVEVPRTPGISREPIPERLAQFASAEPAVLRPGR
jgi:O-succinylbenzoate synthase